MPRKYILLLLNKSFPFFPYETVFKGEIHYMISLVAVSEYVFLKCDYFISI